MSTNPLHNTGSPATALSVAFAVLLITGATDAAACTNFLITRQASADGSTMISYAADSHELYGELYFTPGGSHLPGTMLDIYEWDTGKHLGRIPQARETYSVVGNINEYQVAIGETTFGGRKELKGPSGIVDYGSLMYIALQRARTAREAIAVMGQLVEEHGYASSGESFSISDPYEVWLLEMIGKGEGEKGAVWVARRVPDGYVSAHANQARIRQFPLKDKKSCIYSRDVISFARDKGWFDGKDKDFSFADTYAPLTYKALRICEARVWSMFRRVAPKQKLSMDWIKGVADAEPLPLWIKPDQPLSVHDVMELMRDHFEGTEWDLGQGVGAGPYGLPYRWRPLTWEHGGKKYMNDRSTSTQQTGFSFVAQSRYWLPDPVGGILWFGVDDTSSTVYVPMYCGIRSAPRSFAVGTGDFETFTWDSAFWVFNFVANWAYTRYRDIIPHIQVVQRELEGRFIAETKQIDEAAVELHDRAPGLARDYLTEYSHAQAAETVRRWRELGQQLFLKFLDGNVRDENGKITHPGYPAEWYERVVKDADGKYDVKKIKGEPEEEEGH